MNKRTLWIVPLLLVALGAATWLNGGSLKRGPLQAGLPSAALQAAAPTIGPAAVTPSVIAVNTTTSVTITSQILDSRLIPGSVNLLRINATGTPPSVLAAMHDDGKEGDAVANDKTFSSRIHLSAPMAGQIQLQVSAGFRGVLRRSLSDIGSITVAVGVLYRDPHNGLSFVHPHGFSVVHDPTSAIYTIISGSLPAIPVLTFAFSRQAAVDPDVWFTTHIDPKGVLVSSGSVSRTVNNDGSVEFLILGSPGPAYTDVHGPLPYATILSSDGAKVIVVIGSSEGDALAEIGIPDDQATTLRLSIIDSINVR